MSLPDGLCTGGAIPRTAPGHRGKGEGEGSGESRTLATITFQNYFRMYRKLSGMTGTAMTEAEEFRPYTILTWWRYPQTGLDKNRPSDVVYKNENGKLRDMLPR